MFYAVILIVMTFFSFGVAQNPSILKQNQVQFSSGTVISDLKPDDLAIEVPQSVDFNTYMSYLFSQQVVVPGTINVSVGPSRKMITGRYYGLILTPSINYFQGIRGLSSANVKLGADLDPANPNAWSHVQIGTSNYGSSIWMRLNEDHDAMEISAYRNIQRDSLEPMNPQRLGIQLKPNGSSDVAINNKFYIDDGNVGIGTSHPSEALEVVGNVNLGDHKLLGKIGEVWSASDVITYTTLPNTGGHNNGGSFQTVATFTLNGANQFGADLEALVVASIRTYMNGYQQAIVSKLIVENSLGDVIATSVPLVFDYQDNANESMTFTHFLIFDADANSDYTFKIQQRKSVGYFGGAVVVPATETNAQFDNKRIMVYAIPTN